ncbi:hypothetical protein PR048_018660 [Dryococelus australis]|uniref:Reverse transcriptase domain-containing protein n=1 Tax=Dryococelus australis TaxID=614101 RepID=A0ABQ9HD42_9NEOP|nr:hypothetical protein PR048_018660 [Dryococelus australis]
MPGNTPQLAGSYKPTLLLSCISKVCEKIIFNHLPRVVTRHDLTGFQYGFRPKYSTVYELARTSRILKNGLEKWKIVGILPLDPEKAFDSVCHNLLHNLLPGNSGQCWTFRLLVDEELSPPQTIRAGAPQGSILRLLLLALFIRLIPTPWNAKLSLYADDKAMIATASTKRELATISTVPSVQSSATSRQGVQAKHRKDDSSPLLEKKGRLFPQYLPGSPRHPMVTVSKIPGSCPRLKAHLQRPH